jgi:hypothetical protein
MGDSQSDVEARWSDSLQCAMASAMLSCFSTAESSRRASELGLGVADKADRHLRMRRSPLASATRGLAAVRSRRENFARHLRMTLQDGARLQVCSAAWCSPAARPSEPTR